MIKKYYALIIAMVAGVIVLDAETVNHANRASTPKTEARKALIELSKKYIHSIRDNDRKQYASFFASESVLVASQHWKQIIHPGREHDSYESIKKEYTDDLDYIRTRKSLVDWGTLNVTFISELESAGDAEIEGLIIQFVSGNDVSVTRRIVTGPIKLENGEWKFLSRAQTAIMP